MSPLQLLSVALFLISSNHQMARRLPVNLRLHEITLMRITKRRIALIQLEQALRLLREGDAVSALTLAGAAEEILGKMAVRKGSRSRVEALAEGLGSLYDWAGKPKPTKPISILNEPRNHLKHQNDGRNVRVEADWHFEAEEMILRCMFNHFNAFGYHPSSQNLKSWFEHMTL